MDTLTPLASPSRPLPANLATVVVSGTLRVLARIPEIHGLAAASGQLADLADLDYLFARPSRVRYIPTLILLYAAPGEAPVAAALLVESWLPFGPRRFFLAANRRGRRTVFAPLAHRLEVAAIAIRALLERGAWFVSLEVDLGPASGEPVPREFWKRPQAAIGLRLAGLRDAEWALHPGAKRFDLALTVDLDTTLAALGKKTRRNLRYYQRRCIDELGCRFVDEARLSREEFTALNLVSHFPADARTLRWRFDSLSRFPNVFLAGLRDAQGQWLSLIAGRRNGSAVEVDWQINRAGLERLSLGTVMRCFLIEHEVRAGASSLSFERGTSHTMAKSLKLHSVANLAVRRPSVLLRVAEKLLARFGKDTLVAAALVKPWRLWVPCRGPARPR